MRTPDQKTIQSGDGSEFNSSLAALERMHYCIILAENHSYNDDWQSMKGWLRALQMLDRELEPTFNDNDRKSLAEVRFYSILPKYKTIESVRRKLDMYERELRRIHQAKGMNIKAKDLRRGRADE